MKFGALLREHRLRVLGETLREFARSQGFEAGNLSRVERGLVLPSPGYARDLLDRYRTWDDGRGEMVEAYLQEKLQEMRQVFE